MTRVVIVGASAAGMTAASKIRRETGNDVEVVVFEASAYTSISACGLPYFASGDVTDSADLIVRTPQEHRANGIDVRTTTKVTAVDLARAQLHTEDGSFDYDKLIVATGATPRRLDIEGIDSVGVLPLHTLDDSHAMLSALRAEPRNVVIVGSGPIGIEMAEACVTRSISATIVDHHDEPFGLIEPELGVQLRFQLEKQDIRFQGGSGVRRIHADDGRVSSVELEDGTVLAADLVVWAVGVEATSQLLAHHGVELGPAGGIVVDDHMRVTKDVWAAGDCVAVTDLQTGELAHIPLGTHANKQGMVAGASVVAELSGEESPLKFPGVVRTAIARFGQFEIARTGLGTEQALRAGLDVVSASIETTTRAGYFPGAEPMTVWMLAERGTRRVRGVQIVGCESAGLRIDAAATVITAQLTVDDVIMLDLAYAPPFASVWSPIQVAARAVAARI